MAVAAHPFRVGEDVSLHGGFKFFLARSALQIKLGIESEELEIVMMRRAFRRAGAVVSGLVEIVLTLRGAIRQAVLLADTFGKAA